MTLFDQDSIWRDKTMWKQLGIGGIGISILAISMQVFLLGPQDAAFSKEMADYNAKTLAENETLHSMTCKQLGDWLVTDNWFNRDNLVWAQNHYLVSCK